MTHHVMYLNKDVQFTMVYYCFTNLQAKKEKKAQKPNLYTVHMHIGGNFHMNT